MHVFISYSKQDIDFVRYLRALLEKEGLIVWMDETRLNPGQEWWDSIEQNVHKCSAFVVVMSGHSQKSRWVEREILLAENTDKPIFPVLLNGNVWSRLAEIQYEDMRSGLHAVPSRRFMQGLYTACNPASRTIMFTLEQGNILTVEADVIALKYAQGFYGTDELVAKKLLEPLNRTGKTLRDIEFLVSDAELKTDFGKLARLMQPEVGAYNLIETQGVTVAKHALYIGTPRLRNTTYEDLRTFGRQTLQFLAEAAPETRHVAMTIHGPGFGLDETEALLSQFAGFIDAIEGNLFPSLLEQITIVEFMSDRVERLRAALAPYLGQAHYAEPSGSRWGYRLRLPAIQNESQPEVPAIASAGTTPKNTVFAIWPDNREMDDFFFYGIQTPVHAMGLLCERIDIQEITDEVVQQLKQRIDSAALVIAEMSNPTAFDYLQLGYAWGKGCPVIIVANKVIPPLKDHLHVRYDKIRELESGLAEALRNLDFA